MQEYQGGNHILYLTANLLDILNKQKERSRNVKDILQNNKDIFLPLAIFDKIYVKQLTMICYKIKTMDSKHNITDPTDMTRPFIEK